MVAYQDLLIKLHCESWFNNHSLKYIVYIVSIE
jgi:hypothetical protein